MIGIGGQRFTRTRGTESSERDGPSVSAEPAAVSGSEAESSSSVLPSLEDLRFQAPGRAVVASVLDNVLYGLSREDGARKDPRAQDVRRDIVETAVTIVATAAVRDPEVLDGPDDPHDAARDRPHWSDRFGQLLASVRPVDHGPAITCDVVAQCAGAPVALAKLVSVMGGTVGDRLGYDGRPRDVVMRAHLVNAAVYADIAWCASHGDLAGCVSWRSERQDKSERLILTELKRHLPPEVDGQHRSFGAGGSRGGTASRPGAARSSAGTGSGPGAAGLAGSTPAPRSAGGSTRSSGSVPAGAFDAEGRRSAAVGLPGSGTGGGVSSPEPTIATGTTAGIAADASPAAVGVGSTVTGPTGNGCGGEGAEPARAETVSTTGDESGIVPGRIVATPDRTGDEVAASSVPHPAAPADGSGPTVDDPVPPGPEPMAVVDGPGPDPTSGAGSAGTAECGAGGTGPVDAAGRADAGTGAPGADSLDDWALAAVALTHDPVPDAMVAAPRPSTVPASDAPGPAASEAVALSQADGGDRASVASAGPVPSNSDTVETPPAPRTASEPVAAADADVPIDPVVAPASGVGITLPPAIVDLVGRLLSDGRWPSPVQRDIAELTRSTINDLRTGREQ